MAVGRAIVRKPKVFLFDEPLSNLDAKLRVAMRAEISKLHRRLGATIIYVTHDQVEAMTMADRIFIMNKGVVQQSGAPMEVYAQPVNRFVAGFIGSPAMNFFDARLVDADGALFIDAGSFRVARSRSFPRPAAALCWPAGRLWRAPGRHRAALPAGRRGRRRTITARAEVVETLGAEIFAHLSCGPHALVARMAVPETPLRVGETIRRSEDGQDPRASTRTRQTPSSRCAGRFCCACGRGSSPATGERTPPDRSEVDVLT